MQFEIEIIVNEWSLGDKIDPVFHRMQLVQKIHLDLEGPMYFHIAIEESEELQIHIYIIICIYGYICINYI